MLIQQKREREFARYKGLAVRTLIQTLWLIITALAAYFIIQYLLAAQVFTYGVLRARLAIPNWVPEWAMLAGMILVFVIIMQFFLTLGFFVVKPLGRVRPGKPSMRKTVVDPLEDNKYSHR